MTEHAKRRWRERFRHLDLNSEWALAGRVGKKTKRKLVRQCPTHAEGIRKFKGKYYRLGRNGVVFVVAPPEVIVTVYPLEDSQ